MKGVPSTTVVPLNGYHAPAADTAAIVTIAADAAEAWVIKKIIFSLSAAFTAVTKLNVTFGGVEKFAVDVSIGGVGPYTIDLSPGLWNRTKNEAAVVTLAADSGGDSGSVNVIYE